MQRFPRVQLVPVLCAFALLGTLIPTTNGSPAADGPILALYEPGDATLAGLQAAGFAACSVPATADCYVAVTPSEFVAETSFSGRSVIFVGTQYAPESVGPGYDALKQRKADIEAFVSAGGSLVAMAEPTGGSYEYAPGGEEIYTFNENWTYWGLGHLPYANLTAYGETHPAVAGNTNATLSDWLPSWRTGLGERPSYLHELVEGNVAGSGNEVYPRAIVWGGNYNAGCVVISGMPADEVAAGAAGDPGKAGDAALLIESTVRWGLSCTAVPPPPPVDVPLWAGIRISKLPNAAPTIDVTGPVSCVTTTTGTTIDVECVPAIPPPPNGSWVCAGAFVSAWGARQARHVSTMTCGDGVKASCEANLQGTPPNTLGGCVATAGIQRAPFPIHCIAEVTVYSATAIWSTLCGSIDP